MAPHVSEQDTEPQFAPNNQQVDCCHKMFERAERKVNCEMGWIKLQPFTPNPLLGGYTLLVFQGKTYRLRANIVHHSKYCNSLFYPSTKVT